MSKPKLLFITPVQPSKIGPGISIRAYNNLKALSTKYDIYLLIIKTSRSRKPALEPEMLEMCHDVVVITVKPMEYFLTRGLHFVLRSKRPRELIFLTKNRLSEINRLFMGMRFDVIHVFRLYMVPYVQDLLRSDIAGYLQLDLDDIESITRMRLSELYRLNGNDAMSHRLGLEAEQYEVLEREWLHIFDEIYICSEVDKHKIYAKYNGKYKCKCVKVVPNIVDIPNLNEENSKTIVFNFLFVGTLGYYPNIDAIIYFCDQVIPLIRKDAPMAFSLKIVGMNVPERLASRISMIPEVNLVGPVDDIGPIYELSNAAIIPIRAGGGTRIKALEAFAYRKPVISTSIGVEGIAVNHEQHVMIGDTAEDFARHCIRVMLDSSIRRNMVENSFSLVQSSYNFEVIRKRLCENGAD